MKKLLFLFFSFILLFNCSNDDDSNIIDNTQKELKLKNRISYNSDDTNSAYTQTYTYDQNTGFVKEKIYKTTINNKDYSDIDKYEYSKNKVVQLVYNSDILKSKSIYTYIDDIYKIEVYDRNSNLVSITKSKIENKKTTSKEVYDSNGVLKQKSTYTYKNNGLTEIEYNHITKETNTITYNGKTIKNFHSPFAYLVHNNEPLKVETNNNGKILIYEYELNSDKYPLAVYYYNSDKTLNMKIVNEYY